MITFIGNNDPKDHLRIGEAKCLACITYPYISPLTPYLSLIS